MDLSKSLDSSSRSERYVNTGFAKSRIPKGILYLGVLASLGVGMVACSGSDDKSNQNNSPTTIGYVKNMPLNSCVSVMSGGRPPTGVTIPRCIPTTLPGKPNNPSKG